MDPEYNAGWEDLANAVILQAAEDYRYVCRVLKKRPELRVQRSRREDLEKFFGSRWFRMLSAVNGPELMETIRREVGE